MIRLTRLNGGLLIVNSDLIKYAEASPDTVLTLVSGEKIVVSESCDEVIELALDYRSGILTRAFPAGLLPAVQPTPPALTVASPMAALNAVSARDGRREDNASYDSAGRARRRRNRDSDGDS